MIKAHGMAKYLDIHTVEAFLKVAELNSFTLAAESLCVTQSGVTIKIQRLEKNIGYPLFHRTPRQIYLSPEGEAFLPKAQSLLKAHMLAIAPVSDDNGIRDFIIGISDHVFDMQLLQILNSLRSKHPNIRIKIEVDSSTKILQMMERKAMDVAIVTQDGDKKGGDKIRKENYKWYASNTYIKNENGVSLITLRDSCRLRKVVTELLAEKKIKWYNGFQGGGLSTIIAAAKAGAGVVPLPEHSLSHLDKAELVDVSKIYELPEIPSADVVIHSNCIDLQLRQLLKELNSSIMSLYSQNQKPLTFNNYLENLSQPSFNTSPPKLRQPT
jgi:DNA-binding transcriptional LysR family regulator